MDTSNPQAPKTFTYSTDTPPAILKKKAELLPLFNDKNPFLSERMPEVDFINPPGNLQELVDRMIATMNHYGGAGLAANQCGVRVRMFVMAGGIVCFNPSILEKSDEEDRSKEGCLTYPGLILPILRPSRVKVSYFDVKGKQTIVDYSGATARVFQHELDHLNGEVFTTKVGSLTLQMAKKKKQKMFKKIERIVEYKKRNGIN